LKKANKKASIRKPRSAQKTEQRTSARSSRVAAKKTKQTLISQVAQPKTDNKPRRSKFLTNVLRILALFAVVAITIYIYSIRERVEQFAAFGYPGIFLIALLANATILLPAPGVAVIYAMGAIFNPLAVGLAAGTGGAIGELSGYLAGIAAGIAKMPLRTFLAFAWAGQLIKMTVFAVAGHYSVALLAGFIK